MDKIARQIGFIINSDKTKQKNKNKFKLKKSRKQDKNCERVADCINK